MLKCPDIVGGWGFAPDPTGGAYSAPPDPLAEEWSSRFAALRQIKFLSRACVTFKPAPLPQLEFWATPMHCMIMSKLL